MLAIAVIVFREVLEAALIIGIVMAASYGIPYRTRWIGAGLGVGLLGSVLVALMAGRIAVAFAGAGQELLNVSILLLAVGMLAWHNIWMARHGREMAAHARAVGESIRAGARPLTALAVITASATLREGAETVLFISGIVSTAQEGRMGMILGGVGGLAAGVAAGVALYAGLLRIPLSRLFTVTSWMVLLLAAGLAAQAAGLLIQADLIPALGEQLWDTSFVLSEKSVAGSILHTLLGYVARPAGVQVLVYLITLLAIGVPMRLLARTTAHPRTASASTAALMLGVTLAAVQPARADMKVRYPGVEQGEVEIEHNGLVTIDHRKPERNGEQSYTASIAYGVTSFWKLELEGEFAAGAGQRFNEEAGTLENTFQLTPQGKYFLDLGFFAEYAQARGRHTPNEFVFGPILQKETRGVAGLDLLHTANLFFSHEVGSGSSNATGFEYAWQTRLLLNPYLDPAVEFYGQIEAVGHPGRYSRQEHFVGPALLGGVRLGPGKLKYEVGYQFGLSHAAPTGAARWQLEYEVRF